MRDFDELYGELDERILLGFGGVSEYGITVRWDKNFLTLVYLTLARHQLLRVYGGIRFGGTITLDDAWALGFDHVAIAAGAGKPTIIDIKNNLSRGIRKASDFLMALQLHRRLQEELDREPAGAPPGHRHRRRPHRHRHGDRAARVLRRADREGAARFDTLVAERRRGDGARDVRRRRVGAPRRAARPRARAGGGASAAAKEGARRASRPCLTNGAASRWSIASRSPTRPRIA